MDKEAVIKDTEEWMNDLIEMNKTMKKMYNRIKEIRRDAENG